MPGPEECFESKQALNARFRESNRNISPIEKDYHTNLKECKNDILFIAYEGKARHAHKKGIYTMGKSYRGNLESSGPRYSFH